MGIGKYTVNEVEKGGELPIFIGKFAKRGVNGATWNVSTLDSNKSVGQFPSLAFDGSGDPVISYYRKSGGDLKVQT